MARATDRSAGSRRASSPILPDIVFSRDRTCGSSFLPVKPTIDASLLLPCVDPILALENATDNELAAERLRFGNAYLDCKARQGTLADRVRDDAPPEKKGWLW
jgi:hypothetical protein